MDISRLWQGLAPLQQDKVQRAYRYALRRFPSRQSASNGRGLPHCIEVACILREQVCNAPMIVAALLHALPGQEHATHRLHPAPIDSWEELWMICKLSDLCFDDSPLHWPTREHINDPRLQLLFASHAMSFARTLQRYEPAQRKRLCVRLFSDTVPRLRDLRLESWAQEVEDLCFLELRPRIARALRDLMEKSRRGDLAGLRMMSARLRKTLEAIGMQCTIDIRIKGLYSTYKKMRDRRCTWNEVLDRLALRILAPDQAGCYEILRIIHGVFHPVPGSLEDFIAHPKENGYRALHAVVLNPLSTSARRMVEVQIRTDDMHWTDEFGSASHAKYKIDELIEV